MRIQLPVVAISISEPTFSSSLPQYHRYLFYISKSMLEHPNPSHLPSTLNFFQLTSFPFLAAPPYNPHLSLLCCFSVSLCLCVCLSPQSTIKTFTLIIPWSGHQLTHVVGGYCLFACFICLVLLLKQGFYLCSSRRAVASASGPTRHSTPQSGAPATH